jgi:uncharacterized protein
VTVRGVAAEGKLSLNVMHFARLLRAAGLPVGPGRVLDAPRAVALVDVSRRDDFYWALHAVLVHRAEQRELFDQAFNLFWRDPEGPEAALAALLPKVEVQGEPKPPPGAPSRRLQDLWKRDHRPVQRPPPREPREAPLEVVLSWSDRELLQQKDFAQMSAEELALAKAAMQRLTLPLRERPTRRFRPHPRGERIDLRASLRASLRSGGADLPLKRRSPRRRPPPLVVLCDISGSMESYSRMLLHFLHALSNDRLRVSTFLFGTRLTNVTRYLRHRDVDEALARLGAAVEDWSGGTRIGSSLKAFNRWWSRRVLAQGAVVLLITDGLDREDGARLSVEMERLRKSCRRLVWLNPLLRYSGFEPLAQGIRAMLPHVDDFRPVHNLDSLARLAHALSNHERAR